MKKYLMISLAVAAVLAAGGVLYLASRPAEAKATAPKEEKAQQGWPYRNFVVDAVQSIDSDGNEVTKQVRLSDYVGKGKYILVDFWASWCPPCRAEVPNLKAVYEKYGGERFEIVSVAVWDRPADSFAAIKEEGMSWTQIVCDAKTNQVPTTVYGIEGIPQIILISPEGRVIGDNLRGAAVEKAVKKALGL